VLILATCRETNGFSTKPSMHTESNRKSEPTRICGIVRSRSGSPKSGERSKLEA
jgi:hypothetical protein